MNTYRLHHLRLAISDFFRFWWLLLYWNTRKTLFVLGGRKGRCRCQSPSDDDIPGQIHCEAAADLHRASRFCRVCPLLKETKDGWRCSARAREVRPFWGRALGHYLAAGTFGYLLVVLLAFGFIRGFSGARISPLSVAWPGKWHEIKQAQAQSFYEQAVSAFAAGDPKAAMVALASARLRNPSHYEAALLTGQLALLMGTQPTPTPCLF